jgi:hypothetical protein
MRALVRHVHAQVGLDISTLPAEAFKHLLDIQYSRSGAKSPDTVIAAADAIAAGAQPPPPTAAKSASEVVAAAAVASVTMEDSLAGLRVLDPQDPSCHTFEQVHPRHATLIWLPSWCVWRQAAVRTGLVVCTKMHKIGTAGSVSRTAVESWAGRHVAMCAATHPTILLPACVL